MSIAVLGKVKVSNKELKVELHTHNVLQTLKLSKYSRFLKKKQKKMLYETEIAFKNHTYSIMIMCFDEVSW